MLSPLWEAVGHRAYIIHAEERHDREDLMTSWQASLGVQAELWPATIDIDGRRGCAMSHKLLAAAKKTDGPILVCEDDAIPQIINQEALANLVSAIKSEDYDVIWLGGLPLMRASKTAYSSIRLGASWTTHAMVLSRRAQDWIAAFEWRGIPIDVELANACCGAGAPLVGAWIYPSLFEQAASPSNVRATKVSRLDAFGALLRSWTPIWRRLVFYQDTVLVFLLACLLLYLIQ